MPSIHSHLLFRSSGLNRAVVLQLRHSYFWHSKHPGCLMLHSMQVYVESTRGLVQLVHWVGVRWQVGHRGEQGRHWPREGKKPSVQRRKRFIEVYLVVLSLEAR